MRTYEFGKNVSFKCGNCKDPAKVAVGEDGGIESVFCPSCGTTVDAEDAGPMYLELFRQYSIQEARNLSRRAINKTRIGRVPLTKVGNEFTDPRWPFILILKDHA